MKIAVLSDIHGNLPALDAVLAGVGSVEPDAVVVCGDVAAGPMPAETIRRLQELQPRPIFVRGNADREIVQHMEGQVPDADMPAEVREAVEWCSDRLSPTDRDFLAAFRESATIDIPGTGEILFCHAVPESDTPVFTEITPEERIVPYFTKVGRRTVICGHTHMQFDRMIGVTRVVNAGSVGMPYGPRGAFWLLIDGSVGGLIEFRRTEYDYERAADMVRLSGYPGAEEFATQNILRPPTKEEALEAFEG